MISIITIKNEIYRSTLDTYYRLGGPYIEYIEMIYYTENISLRVEASPDLTEVLEAKASHPGERGGGIHITSHVPRSPEYFRYIEGCEHVLSVKSNSIPDPPTIGTIPVEHIPILKEAIQLLTSEPVEGYENLQEKLIETALTL